MLVESTQKIAKSNKLNSPVGLNVLHKHILSEVPKNSKVGIVVGAGDGRLSLALKSRLSEDAIIYNVEPRFHLHNYFKKNKLEDPALSPWDLQWYNTLAQKHNGFDFIIFHNIHEYWNGHLSTLQAILQLLKPEGITWMSFYNSATLHEMGRQIPPFKTGFERLADPMDLWPRMDISSWLIFASDVGLNVEHIWGLMQKNAYQYCQEKTHKETQWKVKDFSVTVRDIGDAFVLGAPLVCLKMTTHQEDTDATKTRFLGVEYNPSMLQSVLFPFENEVNQELNLFRASVETYAQEHEGEDESHLFLDFFINQLEDFSEAKNVLVVGAGWGADLLGLKKLMPEWKITGIEPNLGVMEQGLKLMKKAGINLVHVPEETPLPFKDGEFDLVISLRYFSSIYSPLAQFLAKEMLRVSKMGIAQFEDIRGPEISMQLKSYNIPGIYETLGHKPKLIPLMINDELSGMYVLTVNKA